MSEERDVSLEGDVADTDIMPSAPPVDDEEGSKSPSADATQVSIMEDGKGSSLDEEQDVEANKTRANAPVMTAVDEPPNKIFLTSLAVVFIIAGSLNTIAAKWADTTPIDRWFQVCYSDGYCNEIIEAQYFDHPFFQADVMFVGEVCCMLAYLVSLMIQRYQWRRRRANHACTAGCEVCNSECPTIPRFNWFLFAIPAFADVVATSMQYGGLLWTSAVSYQMLRGAGIIFTGVMSILFLHMRLEMYQWASMVPVVIGLVIISVIDIIFTGYFIFGDLRVIFAQIMVALQMVAEQKLLADCDVPALFAVGLEGIFGFLILSILMIPISVYTPENALDAFEAMRNSGELVGALCLTVASTAFFNFSGVLVTKYMSATTRMVLGSVCIIIVWPVSDLFFDFGYIPFDSHIIPYQIVAFAFIISGPYLYGRKPLMQFFRAMKHKFLNGQ